MDSKSDPTSRLKSTTKSISHLHQVLHAQGHRVVETTIRRLRQAHAYPLQVTRKAHEGASAPNRDDQFTHGKEVCSA